jgi:acyl-coenzyme A synthetase/AMP-(fatty) acid ligase
MTMGDLPKNAMGKVSKPELAKIFKKNNIGKT